MIAGGQGSEIWLSYLGPTAPKHSRKSSHSRRIKDYSGPRSLRKVIAGGQRSEIWLSLCLGPSRKSSHSRTKKSWKKLHTCRYSGPRSSEKTHKTNIFVEKKKASNEDKSSNYGLRGSQDGGQTLHPFGIFLSLTWKNVAWTEVSHMFRNVFLVHLKVTFGHFVQLVAPTDQWLATMFQITILNSGEF